MRITKGRAYDHHMGGCNFCSRHIRPNGETDHNVTKVTSTPLGNNPSMSVRFCDDCWSGLSAYSTGPYRAPGGALCSRCSVPSFDVWLREQEEQRTMLLRFERALREIVELGHTDGRLGTAVSIAVMALLPYPQPVPRTPHPIPERSAKGE